MVVLGIAGGSRRRSVDSSGDVERIAAGTALLYAGRAAGVAGCDRGAGRTGAAVAFTGTGRSTGDRLRIQPAAGRNGIGILRRRQRRYDSECDRSGVFGLQHSDRQDVRRHNLCSRQGD